MPLKVILFAVWLKLPFTVRSPAMLIFCAVLVTEVEATIRFRKFAFARSIAWVVPFKVTVLVEGVKFVFQSPRPEW